MTQATLELHNQVAADISTCINFISGPSNSVDIEMDIVVGVHGPIKAVYIVVTDRYLKRDLRGAWDSMLFICVGLR